VKYATINIMKTSSIILKNDAFTFRILSVASLKRHCFLTS